MNPLKFAFILLFSVTLSSGVELPTPKFPLHASENGRYLVDAEKQPFFYQADTPWMMLLQLTVPEAEEYMKDRKAKGFSALQIMMTGFLDMKNREGQLPFGPENDLTKPNEKFFAHADKIIQKAADLNLYLMIAPMWSGCCGEGWAGKAKNGDPKPLNLNGPENAIAWGRWLGKRYAKHKHIGWMMGGDKNPDDSHELIRQIARGIHESAPDDLITVHNSPTNSSAKFYDDQPWLTLNSGYTYAEVHEHILAEWQRPGKPRPIILSESGYEHESNDKRGGSTHRIRRQAYGAILSGALGGHAYGHRDLWRVNDKWRTGLQDPGSAQMAHVSQLFTSHAWWTLVPESADAFVTQGRGKKGANTYLTAARSADGSLAIIYIPESQPFTIDLALMKGSTAASWFDPTDGSMTPIPAQPSLPRETFEFTPPGKNADGDSDWLLLLETVK